MRAESVFGAEALRRRRRGLRCGADPFPAPVWRSPEQTGGRERGPKDLGSEGFYHLAPRAPSASGRQRKSPRAARTRFLELLKSECRFFNGTEQVRFLERHIYNQDEFLLFHSDVGEYPVYKDDKQVASRAPKCVQPKVTVYPAKTQPLQHHNLLVCSVSGFYPGSIEVRWFRNDQEEKAGVVSTGLIHNGDWTFQTLVMLETIPQSGEVYICQVEHPSVTSPFTVQWSEQLTS
ncbi:HLA class II histocompatibility antigen, DR beta 3 chain [Saguinus oedipus]|uniref:HLA class II histocompatibility antigen, DR beta 3 chain n=1 Tax=Saguinus oedipus TaxID=9490 RepID=A0ABQ9VY62_SAGOE|nr:HLA class II histocompatibility antigen, DR beta 3 chain [Saguinus oedipus]